jgi:thiamine-phosphate pyrophosphorylase
MNRIVLPRRIGSRIDWRLCFIADTEALAGTDVLQLIGEAVAGGATIIQLRTKKRATREFLQIGMKAVEFLRPRKIPLIINDRVDIALACEADGVHLGQEDMPLPFARKVLGKKKLVGITASTLPEAVTAENDGADYVGVGPIFQTSSKVDVPPVLGLDGVREIRAKIRLPILAIGGINIANAGQVMAAGANGVAVISAIASATNPRQAATELIEAIGKINLKERQKN